jgi:hypothetical protein
MTNNVKKILTHALEILGPNGENWIQNTASEGCKVCLRTAIVRSARDLELPYHEHVSARVRVSKTLGSINKETCIPLFNDDPNTTFKDIKSIVELALDETEVENDGAGD